MGKNRQLVDEKRLVPDNFKCPFKNCGGVIEPLTEISSALGCSINPSTESKSRIEFDLKCPKCLNKIGTFRLEPKTFEAIVDVNEDNEGDVVRGDAIYNPSNSSTLFIKDDDELDDNLKDWARKTPKPKKETKGQQPLSSYQNPYMAQYGMNYGTKPSIPDETESKIKKLADKWKKESEEMRKKREAAKDV